MRAAKQERRTAETHEEREARLERMRAAQQERMTAETHEERETRLERLRAAQHRYTTQHYSYVYPEIPALFTVKHCYTLAR